MLPPWLTRDIDPVGAFQRSQTIVNQDAQERERIKQAREEAAARATIAYAQMANQAQMQQAAQQARQRGQEQEIKAGVEQEAGRLRFAQEGEKRKEAQFAQELAFNKQTAADKMRMLEGSNQRRDKYNADRLAFSRDNLNLRQGVENRRAAKSPVDTSAKDARRINERVLLGDLDALRNARLSDKYSAEPEFKSTVDTEYARVKGDLDKLGQPNQATQASTQGNATIQARVVMANELERANPNWTRQQILDEVKRMIP